MALYHRKHPSLQLHCQPCARQSRPINSTHSARHMPIALINICKLALHIRELDNHIMASYSMPVSRPTLINRHATFASIGTEAAR